MTEPVRCLHIEHKASLKARVFDTLSGVVPQNAPVQSLIQVHSWEQAREWLALSMPWASQSATGATLQGAACEPLLLVCGDPLPDATALDVITHLSSLLGQDTTTMTMGQGAVAVLVVSETLTTQREEQLLRSGAFDCLSPQQLHRLRPSAARALALCHAQQRALLADQDRAVTGQRLAELTEHLQASIEQERAAIAREIHDDIGGALAAVKFDLAWVSRHSTDPAMLAHASAASEMVQHALGASQRIMMNLRPAILDQGLVASVQWLAAGFERRTGVRATVRASSDTIDTPRDVAMVAYRTAQEAMTNISKYAHCTQVRIELTDTEGVLTLEISDNGCGMASADLHKPKAFGIKGLTERARTVGGWLDVGSQPGRGTAITLSVPLSRRAAPEAST